MICSSPFQDFIANCTDAIKVNAHLIPNTNYQWVITDKFHNEFAGSLTTDASGNFQIDVDDLPDSLLNSYAGIFTLQVKALYTAAVVPLNMTQPYEEIVFDVRGGTLVKDNLGNA